MGNIMSQPIRRSRAKTKEGQTKITQNDLNVSHNRANLPTKIRTRIGNKIYNSFCISFKDNNFETMGHSQGDS